MVIEVRGRVIEELERQDRTVSWLARRAELSPSYVGRMLKGERPITDEFKAAAAEILGVDLAELFPAEVVS
jgi:transcriptional regulator with XRE-family HTH domain